jgi:hypothetical membrane protein
MLKKYSALCGVLASITFAVMLLLFGAITPGYDHLNQPVSELGMSSAPYASLWNLLGFCLPGILMFVFAWSLYLEFESISGGRLIAGLVALSGLGFTGLGVFPASIDFQPSTETTLHTIMVMVSYFSFIIVSIMFAVKLRSDPHWKDLSRFSMAMGVIGLLSFAIPRTIPVGVSQRLGLGVNFLWLMIIGFELYRKTVAGGQLKEEVKVSRT